MCVKSQSKIYHKKVFIEIMNKNIRVLNHSQKFFTIKKGFIEILN